MGQRLRQVLGGWVGVIRSRRRKAVDGSRQAPRPHGRGYILPRTSDGQIVPVPPPTVADPPPHGGGYDWQASRRLAGSVAGGRGPLRADTTGNGPKYDPDPGRGRSCWHPFRMPFVFWAFPVVPLADSLYHRLQIRASLRDAGRAGVRPAKGLSPSPPMPSL
jgi:hypothetical protein